MYYLWQVELWLTDRFLQEIVKKDGSVFISAFSRRVQLNTGTLRRFGWLSFWHSNRPRLGLFHRIFSFVFHRPDYFTFLHLLPLPMKLTEWGTSPSWIVVLINSRCRENSSIPAVLLLLLLPLKMQSRTYWFLCGACCRR